MSKITDRVFALAKPVVENEGCSLWDVEYVREAGSWYLRVYIDKEGGIGVDDCEVISRSLSDWLDEEDLPVHLEGLTLDAVYENFVRQIAGDALGTGESTSLKDSVEQQKQREQLEKQIAALEAKIRKEKQPKKKFEMVQKIKMLKERLKDV